MTLASKITLGRLFCAPVFAVLAVYYGESVKAGTPNETIRWWAVGVFIFAAVSDGIDGYIARHFNQRSKFGAFMDPFADKTLLLTGIVFLTFVPWGEGWHIPIWFTALMIARDIIIIVGIWILHYFNSHVPIRPHWTGKVCTVTQMVLLGWVMLKIIPLDPLYPTIAATLFTVWSGIEYFRQGLHMLHDHHHQAEPGSSKL
ncbi:MAG: CDP-alcohol phosphatidyltransferase family protein [Akkermansiaceae bacterium]|nr:CDP-alcohol phosphatidyltransferase family protein [Akkermansiaceae bacterium]